MEYMNYTMDTPEHLMLKITGGDQMQIHQHTYMVL